MAESPVIKGIQDKIDRLIADNRHLRAECDKVAGQRDKIKADNRDLIEQVARMEKRIGVLELMDGMSGGGGDNSKLAKARVNRLMREVDKCIALLNR